MLKLATSICFTVFATSILFAQGLFISNELNEIYEVYPNNNLRLVTTLTGSFTASNYDIAISPSGKFYAVIDKTIIEIDTTDGSSSLIKTLDPNGSYSSLVCSNDNILYTIDDKPKELWKIDLVDSSFTKVFSIGFPTPGDLTFYRGNLIFPTLSIYNMLVIKAFNLQDNSLTDIFCLDTIYNPWGLSTIFNSCGQSRLFLTSDLNFHNFYELDISSGMGFLSASNLAGNGPIYGMASTTEHLASNCSHSFSNVSCNISLDEPKRNSISLYPNPATNTLFISDNDKISELKLYNSSGQLILQKTSTPSSIDISYLPSGIYFLHIDVEGTTETTKLLKE